MKNYVIGMDGGGTRTSVLIADFKQNLLDSFVKGTINYNGSSKIQVDANLEDIFKSVEENGYPKEKCKAICIGAAGVSNPVVKENILGFIKKMGFLCPVRLVGDHEAAFNGALKDSFGIILISGTGSICYGQDHNGVSYRTGGFGHLIDDTGSGYAIGRDILKAVVMAYDGRREATLLTELIFNRLKIDNINQLVSYVYKQERSKKDIAGLSILIEEACERKDKCALEIVDRNVNDLVDLVTPVAKQMKGEIPLAVSGSVLLKNQYIYNRLKEMLYQHNPKITVFQSKRNAAIGAVTLALKHIGAETIERP
ncbi:N-acetylglucosamine kinase [Anaerocolumna sp. MB42-C2]|uniref:N-acetylglucosamine kinase n=1 Tax=Anaerocolumna sp. MB42-C2 TaxID=3070997 RepID=UPI0027E20146|nr:BadF/BadG/BcrA/BcrD ATPase family protein [Anaerocolumna sp. MB42-C2]WMJ86949.1 BadF/BadG/BcrA/BcrD ATPase family protein [Anaerocolumna sp. MB42-C2]